MAVMASNSAIRSPRPGSLYDVLDLVLDKGLVIDAYVRVSLVGIELLTIDARVVIASVDTYLRFAEAANRLDLAVQNGTGLPELITDLQEGGAKHKTHGALEGVKSSAKETVSSLFGGGRQDEGDEPYPRGSEGRRDRERSSARRSSSSSSSSKGERRPTRRRTKGDDE
jgi:hypothetical protein